MTRAERLRESQASLVSVAAPGLQASCRAGAVQGRQQQAGVASIAGANKKRLAKSALLLCSLIRI